MYTDITFEIFNSCSGSCTGCILSALEKKNYNINLDNILLGIDKIRKYSIVTGNKYRIIFGLADIPKIKWEEQKQIYLKCLENNIQFGLTLTLADEDFNYFEIIKKIIEINDKTIFDFTLDPVRLFNVKFTNYRKNIINFIEQDFKKHIQILLSSYILENFKPKELYEKINIFTKNHDIFIGFSPTIQKYTTEKLQQYDFENCLTFAFEFYNSNLKLKEFMKKELKRCKNIGTYFDFTQLVFHIDENLNIYPQIYSLYGDLIQDKRNFIESLGNIKNSELSDILKSDKLKKISVKNQLYLATSEYNCEECNYFNSCNYNGIGLVLNLYKKNKKKLSSCYGPKNFDILTVN
jgi:radical SAM protein with 4Fe4S-binding SPASM domain